MLVLEAQVGRVPVVAVGQQGLGIGEPVLDPGKSIGVLDPPHPVALAGAVGVAVAGGPRWFVQRRSRSW